MNKEIIEKIIKEHAGYIDTITDKGGYLSEPHSGVTFSRNTLNNKRLDTRLTLRRIDETDSVAVIKSFMVPEKDAGYTKEIITNYQIKPYLTEDTLLTMVVEFDQELGRDYNFEFIKEENNESLYPNFATMKKKLIEDNWIPYHSRISNNYKFYVKLVFGDTQHILLKVVSEKNCHSYDFKVGISLLCTDVEQLSTLINRNRYLYTDSLRNVHKHLDDQYFIYILQYIHFILNKAPVPHQATVFDEKNIRRVFEVIYNQFYGDMPDYYRLYFTLEDDDNGFTLSVNSRFKDSIFIYDPKETDRFATIGIKDGSMFLEVYPSELKKYIKFAEEPKAIFSITDTKEEAMDKILKEISCYFPLGRPTEQNKRDIIKSRMEKGFDYEAAVRKFMNNAVDAGTAQLEFENSSIHGHIDW